MSMKNVVLAVMAILSLAMLVSCPKPGGDQEPLPAPANITLVVISSNTVRITWSPVENAEGYNLYRSFTGTDDYVRVNPWLLFDCWYEEGGLPAAMVWYTVAAVRDGEDQTLSTSCGCDVSLLPAPANTKATYLSDMSLRVSWDPVSSAEGYNLYRSSSADGYYTRVNGAILIATSFDDAGLTPVTDYWYKVAAVRDGIDQTECAPVNGYTGYRWVKSYGNLAAYAIQQTSDGGYVYAGSTSSFGAGGHDVSVVKLAADGTVAWQKTYGGSGDDTAWSIQQTADLGFIVAGTTASFGAGGTDVWIVKLAADGSVSWQKTYGGIGNETARSVQQTADEGYIVAGSRASSGAFWVLKLASDGSVTWENAYGSGTDYEARATHQTADEGYIVVGTIFNPSGTYLHDLWVLKLASDGTVSWQKRYGGSGDENASDIRQTADGGYIVAGAKVATDSGHDFWVLKLASDGAVSWQESCASVLTFGYDYTFFDYARSIDQTSDLGYVVTGCTEYDYFSNDLWVVKLASDGTVSWQKRYGGSGGEDGYAARPTTDGGCVIAGTSSSFGGAWILKLPSTGVLPGASFLDTRTLLRLTTYVNPADTAVSPSATTSTIGDTSVTGQDSGAAVLTQYP